MTTVPGGATDGGGLLPDGLSKVEDHRVADRDVRLVPVRAEFADFVVEHGGNGVLGRALAGLAHVLAVVPALAC